MVNQELTLQRHIPRRHFGVVIFTLLALAFAGADAAGLKARWSFNNLAGEARSGFVVADSVTGAPAIVRGTGAVFTGPGLSLPGTSDAQQPESSLSAYVDLPNGLISSRKDLTIEVWASPDESRSWQRMFEFGRLQGPGDGLGAPGEWTGSTGVAPASFQTPQASFLVAFQQGNDLGLQQLYASPDGVSQGDIGLFRQVTLGAVSHTVVTFADGVGGHSEKGGRFIWYINGEQVGSSDVNFRLKSIADVNAWLGRSQRSGDRLACATYDELRIYDRVLTAEEVVASRAAGPNAVLPTVFGAPDAVTMHRGQKVLIDVLGNDLGQFDPGTVRIVRRPLAGSAAVQRDGRVLYAQAGGAGKTDRFTYKVGGSAGDSAETTVTITLSNDLRIPRYGVKVMAEAPPSSVQVVNALPGLTFNQPLCLRSPPGDTKRLFVCERLAKIKLVPDTTAANPTASVFLDLQTMLAARGLGESIDGGIYNEFGLLGLAFHPAYATNRQFFVSYVVKIGGVHFGRLSRFTTRADNPSLADPASESVMIEQLDRCPEHNAADLHFGPDGYLYMSLGDEGTQYDLKENSQKIDGNFFSGIIRIDVDRKSGSLAPNAHPSVPRDNGVARYAVPADNPFVGATSFDNLSVDPAKVRTEFWAVGMRSPWRFSFDEQTGELWCADVGQDAYEEVDLVTRGGNYGWAYREGSHPGARPAPARFTSIPPVYEYPHTSASGDPNFKGNSVTGGVVQRGGRFAVFEGAYIFSDFVSGNIWALRREGGTVNVVRIGGKSGIASFGLDPANHDVLLADYDGTVRRLVAADQQRDFPETLSATGLFADLKTLSPNPGLLPYAPNVSFWSDHAIKRRWFSMPDTVRKVSWSRDEPWTFPTGTLWVKHFDLELTRGDPATTKRLETRLLVRDGEGVFGVSYRWNDAGTEATLVDEAGVDFDLPIVDKGVARTQTWHIPSRAECGTCHNPAAGLVLGFNTRQLNSPSPIPSFAGNQLDILRNNGLFDRPPDPAAVLPRHARADETRFSSEARVRSYLSVNCAYCHLRGGLGTTWDGGSQLTLEQTRLLRAIPFNNGGDPANRLLVPGDPEHSLLLSRIIGSHSFSRMPPLATNELDQKAISLVTEWIQNMPAPGAGTFNGLVRGKVADPSLAGTLSVTLMSSRSFSFTAKIGAQSFAKVGQFDPAGRAQVVVSAPGKPLIELRLELGPSGDAISGSLVQAGTVVADVAAAFAGRFPAPERSPYEGRYTLVIPGTGTNDTTVPGGFGYATGSVNAMGVARLAGVLGDGTPISQSAPLSATGEWPFHLRLYGGKGSLEGTLTFRDRAESDLDGTLTWLKPTIARGAFYPAGFSGEFDALGSRHRPMSRQVSGAEVAFSAGKIVPAFPALQVRLSPAGKFTILNAPGNSFTLSRTNGFFSGKLMEAVSKTPRIFRGVLLEKSGEGFGWFPGAAQQTGAVEMTVPPAP